ncbi:hypothetical protein BDF14DRAFT_819676 [Spinellus fusiger]|nr:hypothetical protein BDF14DRAFT_819676 [Spinellus fusiger]
MDFELIILQVTINNVNNASCKYCPFTQMQKQTPFSSWLDFFITLISFFGFNDLVQVVCWYCNESSYIRKEANETKDHWHCLKCVNDNILDENGDIVDSVDAMYAEQPDTIVPICQSLEPIIKKPVDTICDKCMEEIMITDQVVGDCIPDVNRFDYDICALMSDSFYEGLLRITPQCEKCTELVERTLPEKTPKNWPDWHSDTIDYRNSAVVFCISSTKSRALALWWGLVHASWIIVCLHAIIYPVIEKGETMALLPKIVSDITFLANTMITHIVFLANALRLQPWMDYFSDGLVDVAYACMTKLFNEMEYFRYVSSCVVLSPFTADLGQCQPIDKNVLLWIFGSLLLTRWAIWHPILSDYVPDMRDVRYWKTYTGYHKVMFYFRIALPVIIRYCHRSIFLFIAGTAMLSLPIAIWLSIKHIDYYKPDIPYAPACRLLGEWNVTPEERNQLTTKNMEAAKKPFVITDEMRAEFKADREPGDFYPKKDPYYDEFQFEDEDRNLSPRSLWEREYYLVTKGFNGNYERALYRFEDLRIS